MRTSTITACRHSSTHTSFPKTWQYSYHRAQPVRHRTRCTLLTDSDPFAAVKPEARVETAEWNIFSNSNRGLQTRHYCAFTFGTPALHGSASSPTAKSNWPNVVSSCHPGLCEAAERGRDSSRPASAQLALTRCLYQSNNCRNRLNQRQRQERELLVNQTLPSTGALHVYILPIPPLPPCSHLDRLHRTLILQLFTTPSLLVDHYKMLSAQNCPKGTAFLLPLIVRAIHHP